MDSQNEKKAAIVRAAFDVLMSGGVQALSFESVAQSAGLSRQLVRYYFEDSEALMVALCDYLAELYRSALIGGVAKIEEKNRLDFFFDFYFDLLSDDRKPRDDQAYDAVFSWAAGSDQIRSNLSLQYGLLGQVVSHEIALKWPELSPEQCGELSYLFVCLMYGHWKMVATLGYAEDHKYIARRALDRLIDSYLLNSNDTLKPVKPWALQK
ncbi:MAG: TetR/AcrR family transcriptional regulator [Pseudomonadota bacterium]